MRKIVFKYLSVFFVLVITGFEVQNAASPKKDKEKVHGIILFIGDGMGDAQISASMAIAERPFYLERFPYTGYCQTSSSNNYITDSAAGGTAIACGVKTKNGMIGMGPDSVNVKSIMAIAHRNGLATGLVSTKAITDATPASFVSHNAGRGNMEDIAKDFLNGDIDLFIGGGKDNFSKRKDSTDLTIALKRLGYDVLYTEEDLFKSGSMKIAGLLAGGNLPKASERSSGSLAEYTRKAIATLSRNKNGFVLMVEGGMIDIGGHGKDIDFIVSEMVDLDKAVGVALEYAEKNKEILVVMTADHETGGLTLTGSNLKNNKASASFSTSGHTAAMVPVFAYGPGAGRYSGIHENTFFLNEFLRSLQISDSMIE